MSQKPLYRVSHRAQLIPLCAPQALYTASQAAYEAAQALARQGVILTAGIYRFGSLLFSYCESTLDKAMPDEIFAPFTPLLLDWPGEDSPRKWVEMRPVYFQQIPQSEADWERPRPADLHIGRLSRLIPEKANEYLYYHHALTEEGLNKGDKYQFISYHEDYLFSYYEEPRTNVNVRRTDEGQSQVIRQWIAADPASHFYRFYPGAEDFIHLPSLFIVQRQADALFTAPPLHPDR